MEMIMIKTTVYLDESELRSLKSMAAKQPGKSVAQLIREGVRYIVKNKPKKDKFSYLRKLLHEKPRKSSFGDPVAYQRKLRDEWDY